jgi:hypothetical protein
MIPQVAVVNTKVIQPGMWLEGLTSNTTILYYDDRTPGRGLNSKPSKYKVKMKTQEVVAYIVCTGMRLDVSLWGTILRENIGWGWMYGRVKMVCYRVCLVTQFWEDCWDLRKRQKPKTEKCYKTRRSMAWTFIACRDPGLVMEMSWRWASWHVDLYLIGSLPASPKTKFRQPKRLAQVITSLARNGSYPVPISHDLSYAFVSDYVLWPVRHRT